MVVEKAAQFHHGKEGYNCAQAVRAAWNEVYGTSMNVDEHRAHGGGRAEGGLCGALYAAIQIDPAKEAELKDAFQRETGTLKCREIRQDGKVSCKDCVRLAARTLKSLSEK